LYIRVSFAGGIIDDPAFLSELTIRGWKTTTVSTDTVPVSITSPASFQSSYDPSELRDDWGIQLNGGSIVVGTNSDASATAPQTIELWIKKTSATNLTIDGGATATTTYVNGTVTTTYSLGRWTLIHIVNSSGFPTLTVSGLGSVGMITRYSTALTLTQSKQIHDSYVGVVTTKVNDTASLSITEPASASGLYAHEWAIVSSG